MNLLAHLLLSPSDPEVRLGNVAADFFPKQFSPSPGVAAGIRIHRQIDAFTDRHPVVQRARRRFSPGFSRVSGILIDVFFDHILSLEWAEYGDGELNEFVADFYQTLVITKTALPAKPVEALDRMIEQNWLGCYGTREGMILTLERIQNRMSRQWRLPEAYQEFQHWEKELRMDFIEFFPALRNHIRSTFPTISNGEANGQPPFA